MTLVYCGGPLDGQTLRMPAGLLRDLPPIRVPVRTKHQNHFYRSRKWNGRDQRLDLIYRGIVGIHSRVPSP